MLEIKQFLMLGDEYDPAGLDFVWARFIFFKYKKQTEK
jgi:hypothetical protein